MRARPIAAAAVVGGPLVALACGSGYVEATAPAGTDAGITPDASTVDTGGPLPPADAGADADAGPCDTTKDFGAPAALGNEINSGVGDYGAWLSPDELTIFFTSLRDGNGTARIFTGKRASRVAPFGSLAPVDLGVQVMLAERPSLTKDLSTLYFSGPGMPRNIYKAQSLPLAGTYSAGLLTAEGSGVVNSTVDELDPYLSDSAGLFFASNRNGPYELYQVDLSIGGVGSLASLTTLSGGNTIAPVVSSDGLTIYFASDRSTGANKARIFVSTRPNLGTSFKQPDAVTSVNAVPPVEDRPNWLSPDGCRLYMTSTRGDGKARIYVASKP